MSVAKRDEATLALIKQGVCLPYILHARKKNPVYNKWADLRTASGGFDEYEEREGGN